MTNELNMLKKGVITPKINLLKQYVEKTNLDESSVLNINCGCGHMYEVLNFLFNYNMHYYGIDENEYSIKEAMKAHPEGNFRSVDYDKMKLKTKSYDSTIIQGDFLNSKKIVSYLDKIFRTTKDSIILYDMNIIPEHSYYVKSDDSIVYGLIHFKEFLEIFQPRSVEYSLVGNLDCPADVSSSIFFIRI